MTQFNLLLLLLAVWIGLFFESAFGGFRHWIGAQVDFLPPLMVYASLSAGLPTVVTVAVAGGVLYDSLSANPLGVSIAPLFLAGLFIHARRDLVLREEVYAQMTIGAATSAFVPLATLLLASNFSRSEGSGPASWRDDSMPGGPLLGWQSLWHWLVLTLFGALFTPVCFRIFDACNRLFNYQPIPESSFRPDRQIKRSRL